MVYLALVILIGIGIGYARGGSLGNLSNIRLAWVWLLYVGIGMQVAAQFVPVSATDLAYVMVLVSFALVFFVAWLNRKLPGMLVVGIGALANFVVITANRGMPVSQSALVAVGKVTSAQQQGMLLRGKHFVDAGSADLRFLGDNIVFFHRHPILSIGDLIMWVGIAFLVQYLMCTTPKQPTREPA